MTSLIIQRTITIITWLRQQLKKIKKKQLKDLLCAELI